MKNHRERDSMVSLGLVIMRLHHQPEGTRQGAVYGSEDREGLLSGAENFT